MPAGQRERAHRAVGPADANDRVLAAVGEPCGLVRALDDAVRRRAGAERDELDAAARRIEPAEVAAALRREPDAAIGRGRDVVDAGALARASGQLRTACVSLRARSGQGGRGTESQEREGLARDRFNMAASARSSSAAAWSR